MTRSSPHENLAAALDFRKQGRPDAAVASALAALKEDPSLGEAWECAARIYMRHHQWKAARGLLENAVKYVPGHVTLETYYALALAETDAFAAATARIEDILRRAPDNPQALFAHGEILASAGDYVRAQDAYAEAGKHDAVKKSAAFGLASARFISGDFAAAMPGLSALEDDAPDAPPLPLWDGNPARHVLLYGSQGFGDILMFLRYVKQFSKNAQAYSSPLGERLGEGYNKALCTPPPTPPQGEGSALVLPRVTLRIPYQLVHLVRDSFPDLSLVATKDPGDTNEPKLPHGVGFDLPKDAEARCPLIRLSWMFGAFNPRAGDVPYLRADAAKITEWEEHLAAMPRPRIGLVWSGSPRNAVDHRRSMPFELLQPVIDRAKPHLVSLQMGPESKRANEAGIFDAAPMIRDFSDSAALMNALDLVITVDTAAAHLAAALGKPVWNMMPFKPTDWRWLLGREDTIWYPSMRLFRQKTPGDWPGVVGM